MGAATPAVDDYINLEWRLIPLCRPADGRGCAHGDVKADPPHGPDCPHPGKRPLVRGWRRSLPTSRKVRQWAKRWPDANWAVLTGAPSGVVVLDVDDEDAELPGGFGLTPLSLTGRGRHYFFRFNPKLRRSQRVDDALEFKSTGSYVVLPESLHPSGTRYVWTISPWELGGELAPVPDWLARKQREQRNGQSLPHKRPLADVVRGVREGERNIQAARIAGKLLGALPPRDWEGVAWPLLVGWNSLNKPPLPLKELRGVFDKIADRELRKALRNPRVKELQARIERVLEEQPGISLRDLKRKLHAHRYPNFEHILFALLREHPPRSTNTDEDEQISAC